MAIWVIKIFFVQFFCVFLLPLKIFLLLSGLYVSVLYHSIPAWNVPVRSQLHRHFFKKAFSDHLGQFLHYMLLCYRSQFLCFILLILICNFTNIYVIIWSISIAHYSPMTRWMIYFCSSLYILAIAQCLAQKKAHWLHVCMNVCILTITVCTQFLIASAHF